MARSPSVNGMPRLGVQPDLIIHRFVHQATGDRGRTQSVRHLLSNAARLTDRAIVAYERLSDERDRYIEEVRAGTGGMGPWYSAVTAAEECVNVTWRATQFVEALVRRGEIRKALKPRPSDVKDVKALRDAMQHLDNRIRSVGDTLADFEYLSVTGVGNERLVLHDAQLDYAVLARVVRALHAATMDRLD